VETFVLTVNRESARCLRSVKRLQQQGLKPNVVHTPILDDRKLGPCLAHKCVTDFALLANLQEVLIFEDDVVLRKDAMEIFYKARAEVPEDCMRLLLGSLFYDRSACADEYSPNALYSERTLHTHAYWLSRAGIVWQSQALLDYIDLRSKGCKFCHDAYLSLKTETTDFNVHPIVAIQESGHSDVNNRFVVRGPTYFGGFGPWKAEDFLANCYEEDKQFVVA
jgi:hypothetical protein